MVDRWGLLLDTASAPCPGAGTSIPACAVRTGPGMNALVRERRPGMLARGTGLKHPLRSSKNMTKGQDLDSLNTES